MRFVSFIVAAQILCCVAQPQTNNTQEDRTITSIITPKHNPRSLSEMSAQSAVIVIGMCEQELPARFFVPGNPKADLVTDRIVRVTAVLKGDVPVGTRIAVEQLGGTMPLGDGVHTVKKTIVHQIPLQSKSPYVLFLRPEPQLVNDVFDGKRYVVTGEWAGILAVVDGRIIVSEAAEPVVRQLTGLSEADIVALIKKSL